MLREAFVAVEKVASIGDNLTDADQQQLRLLLAEYKRFKKAINFAEQIFNGKLDTKFFGDNSFVGTDSIVRTSDSLSEKDKKQYQVLRANFNKND